MLMNIGHEVQLSQHQLLTPIGWQRRLHNPQLLSGATAHTSFIKLRI